MSFGVGGKPPKTNASGAVVIAASDAPRSVLSGAYAKCDGQDDQALINDVTSKTVATTRHGNSFGAIELTSGRFSLRGSILIPGRGWSLSGQGWSTELYGAKGTGSFDNVGEGSQEALIMIAPTAAGRNACEISIDNLYFNCSDASGVSGIWIDQSAGGDTGSGSEDDYGNPTTATGGDTYHSLSRLRMRGVEYGIGMDGGSGSTFTRGNNVHDVRMNGVSVAGYYVTAASDCHFNQCHAITSNAASAVGFSIGGGNTRLTGCKAAYFNSASCWGFDFSSSRISAAAIEAQDNQNGIRVSSQDMHLTGARVETQDSPCDTAFHVTSGASNAQITGLYIHIRNSGTYTNGLCLPTSNATTGTGDHMIQAFIDPTGITNALVANNTPPTTNVADVTALSTLEGSSGVGCYQIRVIGVNTFVST